MPGLPEDKLAQLWRSASRASRRRCRLARRPRSMCASPRSMPSSSRWCARSSAYRQGCMPISTMPKKLLGVRRQGNGRDGRSRDRGAEAQARADGERDPHPAAPQGRGRRQERHPRSPRRHRRRRGGAVRRRSAAHVPALCRPPRLEVHADGRKPPAKSAATRKSSPISRARAPMPG